MSDELTMIAEATGRIFADLADPQTVNAARDDQWQSNLWQALDEAGLTGAWGGGADALPLDTGFEILRIAGQYACPVALPETMLARWILEQAGLDPVSGPLTLAPMRRNDDVQLENGVLNGACRSVPFGAEATVVIVHDDAVSVLGQGVATATPRTTDMGGVRADLHLDSVRPVTTATLAIGADGVALMGAAARASLMAGALETMLDLTTRYTGEREAFGRKIGKFQAVQQNLARLAGEVAAALTAAGSAADTLANEPLDSAATFLEVAAAKIRCGEAAETGVAIAHQAHGAIGWTQDHVLQRYSRRILGWRDDFGTEAEWAVRLGQHMAAQGSGAIWPALTTR